MRLGLKIFILMFVVAFTVSGATGSYFYLQSRDTMLQTVQSQLLTAAASYAGLIPGDTLLKLTTPEDMDSLEYKQIQSILYQITQTNQDFLFAYTMRLQDDQVLFVVDSPPSDDTGDGIISEDEMPEPIGAVYPDPPHTLLKGFARPSVDDTIYEDQWGWTISGYAPVLDSQGRHVGLLGIDMCADHLGDKLADIRKAGLLSLAVSGLLAVCFTMVLARNITRPIKELHSGFSRVGNGDLSVSIPVQGRDELADLAGQFNEMVSELKEKQLLKSSLGKVMHKEVVSRLLTNDLKLGGETAQASILFCDLRGFTGISEKLPPKILVSLLNDYFSLMVRIVEKNGGMVDKFIGDKLMSVFGHPNPFPGSAASAFQAGLEMLEACDDMNASQGLQKELHLENSIGLHTGLVLAGNIGSPERMEYTVIGDAVNTAARLEAKTRQLKTRLAVSSITVQELDSVPENLIYCGEVDLEGRREKLGVYTLAVR